MTSRGEKKIENQLSIVHVLVSAVFCKTSANPSGFGLLGLLARGCLGGLWGLWVQGPVHRGALGFPQHSFPAPAACSPSCSAFTRRKHAGYNRDFCSFLFFLFPFPYS